MPPKRRAAYGRSARNASGKAALGDLTNIHAGGASSKDAFLTGPSKKDTFSTLAARARKKEEDADR